MRGIVILLLLVCLTNVRARTVSSDGWGTTNSADSSHKPSIYVDGQVKKPGHYAWFPGMTVIDAIEAANGFENATNHTVWITRIENGHRKRLTFDADTFSHGVKKAPPLKDGDTISAPNRVM